MINGPLCSVGYQVNGTEQEGRYCHSLDTNGSSPNTNLLPSAVRGKRALRLVHLCLAEI